MARRDHQSLVVVKTRVPRQRAGLVRRTDIVDRLVDDLHQKVTVIQAPAGYGKSTALLQWVEADPVRRFAWVTLEEADNEPVLFWRYLLLAITALAPGFGGRAEKLLTQPQPDIDELVREVLNHTLDLPGRFVLVLDDYHTITNPECHRSLQYFIDHLPDSMHVALGTRSRPPLSFSKLEANGQLLSIDADSLRFSLLESKKAIENTGTGHSRDDMISIHERCEGWPAGVYLCAMTADPLPSTDRAPAGLDTVRSYLTEQMLDELPEDERSALTSWSILRYLNASVCDRVVGRSDSANVLHRLSTTNLLLQPLGAGGDWYRLHDLLRDALRTEFTHRSVEEQQLTHLRAMEWYLENEEPAEAIPHALEADLYTRAAELICTDWMTHMLDGWLATLRKWIDQFPSQAMIDYPPILVASAWIAAFDGDAEATHRLVAAARQAEYDGPMPDGTSSYTSAVEILQAGLGHRGMKDANEHAELAFRLEPQGSPWRQMAAALVGVTRFGLGQYEDARSALREASRIPTGPDGVGTYARGQLALLEMHEGRWDEGSRQADVACSLIEESNLGNLLSSGAALVAAAAVAAHVGNRGLAVQRLCSLAPIQKVLSDAIPFDAFQIHLIAAETYLLLGDHGAASIHARSATSRLETFGDAGIFEERLAKVQVALRSSSDRVDARQTEPNILTDRELEILSMLQSDLTLRDIGSELFVSRNTAKSHVASVYRKLGVTSRTAAVARARQLELI